MALTSIEKHDLLTSLLEKKRKKQQVVKKQEAKIRALDRRIEALISTEERDD